MCDKTSLKWLSGSVIKQGDVSSKFKIRLDAEDEQVLNGAGRLQLVHTSKGMVELEIDIVNNVFSFKLEKALPVGVYVVEVEHAGYVFPSTNDITLTVNENVGEFASDKAIELYGLKELIQKYVDEKQGEELPDLLMFYNIAKI